MTEQTRHFLQVAIYCGIVAYRLAIARARWGVPLMRGPEYFLGKRVPEGFYQGPGAAILRTHRMLLLAPWLLEAIVVAVLLAAGVFIQSITWLLLGVAAIAQITQVYATRHSLRSARRYILPGEPPTRVALPLETREFKRYSHPALEIAILAATFLSIAALISHDGIGASLFPAMLACYVQIGLVLIKRSLVDWRSAVPVKDAELYHQLRECQRRHFMRMCDWLRTFSVFFLGSLVAGAWWGEDAARWYAATVGIAFLVAFMTVAMSDMRRLLQLSSQLKPAKLPKTLPDPTATGALLYRPDHPTMFIRRTRGWAVNFGNPRALIYAGYIVAGLLLGAAKLRAADLYSMTGVRDQGTFGRYVGGKDTATIAFDWQPDGKFENHLKAAQTRDIQITPDGEGRWQSIDISTPNSVVHVRREGDAITADGVKVSTTPGTLPYGPPALLALAVRAYDPQRGGKQPVHLLNLPDTLIEATIEPLARQDSFKRYVLSFPGADQILYVDQQGKVVLAHNPRENSGFMREGFAALRTAAAASDPLPPSIKGRWEGTLAGQLRVIFQFAEKPGGGWQAFLQSPDQGPGNFDADEVKFDGKKLSLSIKEINGGWEGTFDGRKLEGKWSQGQDIPLTLIRPGVPPAAGARKWGIPLTPCRTARDQHEGMCGSLEVFENRAAASGRKIKLVFVVIPSKAEHPAPDPVFLIAGGPGQGSIEAFATVGYLKRFVETRDVVLVDQRGTGGSNRLPCPPAAGVVRNPGPEALRQCRAELEEIADLRMYTTSIAMDDLDDIRAALGYSQINVMGGSYGTRAALEYLRRHEDRTRTVILKGVAPMGYRLPLPFARNIQDALDHLFKDCAADSRCSGAYPKLREEFEAVLDRLGKEPAKYKEGQVRRDDFLDVVRPMLYSPQVVAVLPVIIHRAYGNDFAPLTSVTQQLVAQLNQQIARGMSLSVICAEDVPFISDEEVARETKGTYMGDANVRRFRESCSVWPHADVLPSFHDPVRSTRPVLLISGEEDPATPPSAAAKAMPTLPNSRHVIIPGGTHGTEDECIDKLAAEFVVRGSAKDLDISCAASIKRPEFVVP